jgi:hypothetical protein
MTNMAAHAGCLHYSGANVDSLFALRFVHGFAHGLGVRGMRLMGVIAAWPHRGLATNEFRAIIAGEAEKLLFVAVVAGTGIGREHALVRALAAVMVGHERQVQSSMLVG